MALAHEIRDESDERGTLRVIGGARVRDDGRSVARGRAGDRTNAAIFARQQMAVTRNRNALNG